MAFRAYLAMSNLDTIYPSFVDEGYDSDEQTVVTCVDQLPLLWLALFREDDLRRQTFDVDGEATPAFAPVCSKQKALAQLAAALPRLERALPELGPLGDYVAMFRAAIEPMPYEYVTIELEEVASMRPEEHRYDELLTLALRGFDSPEGIRFHCEDATVTLRSFSVSQLDLDEMDDEASGLDGDDEDGHDEEDADEDDSWGDDESFDGEDDAQDDDEERDEHEHDDGEQDGGERRFVFGAPQEMPVMGFTCESHSDVLRKICGLREAALPSVRRYLDNLECDEDEDWNFTQLLGVGVYGSPGYGREVPWEHEDADYGWQLETQDDDLDEVGPPEDWSRDAAWSEDD